MKASSAQAIKDSGRYVVKAARLPETDLLSVYVDRVKKLFTNDPDQDTVEDILDLQAGDLVESTGTLRLEKISPA